MKLRIALVSHHALGGSGVMAVEWAHLLARRGHDVHLVRCGVSTRDAMPRADWHEGPGVHVVEARSHPVLDGPSPVAAVTSALLALHEAAPLDVVHIHYALPFALAVPLLLTLPSPPRCVVSLHGSDVMGIGGHPEYRPALALALRSASAVTVPSAWLAREARSRGIAEATTVLPNFIDLDHFTPGAGAERPLVRAAFGADDGTPVLLHVSNLRPVKRAADAVRVAAALGARRPVRLAVVGDGPERAAVEQLASDLGVDAAFVGAMADPAPWFREADCLLLPSESESFGLVALEALASGTPVVASNVGGLPDWLAGVPVAALPEAGDIDGFVAAVASFLAPAADRSALRTIARQAAMRLGDPDAAVRRVEALYTTQPSDLRPPDPGV